MAYTTIRQTKPKHILLGFLFIILAIGLTAESALSASDIQPITFLDSPDPVPASGTVSYLVVVQNNDPDFPANDVRLTVNVPLGFSFAAVDDANCGYDPLGNTPSLGGANDRIVCDWSSITLRQTVNLDFTASAIPGTYQVFATTTSSNDSNPANNQEDNLTDVVESADLELLSKSGTPDTVNGGGIVTYQFVVTNNGPFAAENPVLSDTLPTGLTFVADNASPAAGQDGAWACSATGQDVSCSASSLSVGATSTFYFRVRATSSTTGPITNPASITSDTPEPNPDNNEASGTITIIEGTDVAIAKSVDTSPVIGGQPAQFTLTATNNGPWPAAGIVVTDTFPLLYTSLSVINTPTDWTCDDPITTQTVTCRADTGITLAAGQSVDIILSATPPVVDDLVTHQNGASITTTTPDPISSNDTILVNYDVLANIADLALEKVKGPSPVVQGSNVTSTISVRNNGPQDADIVEVVDVLSPGETFVSNSSEWTCVKDPVGAGLGGTLTCNYNGVPLAAGAPATDLTIVTEATNTGYLTNTACTGGSGGSRVPTAGDSITTNNCSNTDSNPGDATILSTAEQADLVVDKRVVEPLADAVIETDQDSFSYGVTITNNGPQVAESVEFNDIIPQHVSSGTGLRPETPITVSTVPPGLCSYGGSGAGVNCNLGDIAVNDSVEVTITIERPMKDGPERNTASAYSLLTGDPDRSNNSDYADVEVDPQTDIEVTDKIVTYAGYSNPIVAETIATYTIGVRNNGPSVAPSVVLTDTFVGADFEEVGTIDVQGGGSCTWANPGISCTLGDMNPATTKFITLEIRPDHYETPPTPSWTIANEAVVSMDAAVTDYDPTNNSKTQFITVTNGSADLAIEKNESPSFTEPVRFDPDLPTDANQIVYEVVISNRGPSRATNVVFRDNVVSVNPLLPSPNEQQLEFVGDTSNSDGTGTGVDDICVVAGANPFTLDGGPDINCSLPSPLQANSNYTRYLVFTVLDAPDPLIGDSYTNSVTVSADEPDLNPANDTEGETTTVRTVADLGINKLSVKNETNQVEVEEGFDFLLAITNYGPGVSPGATVADNLPSGMVLTGQPYASVNPNGVTVACSGAADDTSFSCVLGKMDYVDTPTSLAITVPVKVVTYPASGTITNSATVTGLAPEKTPNPTPNTDDHTVGVYQPAVIGDRVWLDRNNNGLQDGGESGINGATVHLLNSGGTRIATTTTSGGGYYSFTVNSAGTYGIEFEDPSGYLDSPQNVGGDDTIDNDADPATGRTVTTYLDYGEVDNTFDAGYYQRLSLGDRIWLDSNGDGSQDAGELGIGSVTVELFDSDDNSIAVTTTDGAGNYLFSELDPGSYYIQISPPAWVGYLASPVQSTTPNDNNNTDSNIADIPSANLFESGVIALTSRTEPNNDGDSDRNTNLTLDMGLVLPANLGNRVWLDENSDGIQDAGEPGIAGVTLQLKDSLGNVLATTVTDSEGGYLFRGLAPDDYIVQVDGASLPAGMSQTTTYPSPGDDLVNQNQSVGHGYPLTLVSGGEDLSADFGYNWSPTTDVTGGTNTGAIGDRVWIDSNGNGVQDAGEKGVMGVLLTLSGPGADGFFGTGDDAAMATATTDYAGNYIFDNLVAGAYRVEVSDSSLAEHDILNGTDYQQTGDPDHFAADSTQAATGTAGDNLTTEPVILGPGDTYINVDFGYQPQAQASLLSIGDTVWLDLDRDGSFDVEEQGIAGVTMGLQNSLGEFIAGTTTDAFGNYLFTDLPDTAIYTVVVVDSENVLAGMILTYDADDGTTAPDGASTLTLGGADDLDQDFGYIPINPGLGNGAIGDTIFLDMDDNSLPGDGEGIEGVRIFLQDSGGAVVAVAFTDENGKYIFSGLAAGDYRVEVDTTTLPAGLENTVDPDGGSDSVSDLTLADNEINLLQDFGYRAATPNSIGNLVWKDSNADGIYQPNGLDGIGATADDETPLEGITVDLYNDVNNNNLLDPGEPLIAGTITDSSGAYLFQGLPDGNFIVDITDTANILEGYFHSTGAAATDNNSQTDYYALSVSGGISNLTADFGYYHQPGGLGNLVWHDVNVNGLYDSGIDTPLAGVTLFLDIVYPDGTLVTVQSQTDSNGFYNFNNLLTDEHYNGIGSIYGAGGDEPSHTLRLDTATVPAPLVSIYPTRAGNTDSTTVGGIPADQEDVDSGSDSPAGEPGFPPQSSSDSSNDFGFFAPGSIGDTIWNDHDNDGIFDSGEGLSGISVQLTPPADVNLGGGLGVAVTISTGANGSYLFSNLPPGDYTVSVLESSLPFYLQGRNTVDPDGGFDSMSDLTLAIAEDNLDQDFGYFSPSTIGNLVWNDSNGNGLQDNGEGGRQGVAVHLLDGSGNPVENPVLPGVDYIVQTDGSGGYLFENLLPGNYQVRFVLQAGNTFTTQNSGGDDGLDSDADPSSGLVAVVLGPNEVNLTIDAGLVGPAINIEKSTNDNDADTTPGVLLAIGDSVAWEYVVTNTGNVTLTSVAVSDSDLGAITCPQTTLAAGDSMTCSANGTATAGQYANIGSVIGSPPSGPAVLDSDPSHYLAGSPAPAIDIEKATNGVDADSGTGPLIGVGEVVTWTYVVTNTGNADLTDVSVSDNVLGAITCAQNTLAIGDSMTCMAVGTATAGQYSNIGSVSATPPSGPDVTDTDPSHYYGTTNGTDFAEISLEKSTNGSDADSAPGPNAETGYTVTWTYLVTNTGDVDLTNVTVTDDQLPDTAISCPNDGNTDNSIVLLPAGTSATCTASGIAIAGQYANNGSVTGTPPTGPNVNDSDPSHYFGSSGAVDLEKYTNGRDADTEPGPTIYVGKDVHWTYVVTNTGLFTLTSVIVVDDQGEMVSCPQTTLAPGESMTCTADSLAVEGQYANLGTVTAATPAGDTVSDTDPSHYRGSTFFWGMFMPAMSPSCPPVPDYCYIVADGDNEGSNNSALFSYVFSTSTMELLNRLGEDNIESITLSPDGKTLYAADDGVFGIIDPASGLDDSFTPIDPQGVGSARGALGRIAIVDIDGLAFDPKNGELFGSVRYGDGMADSGQLDLLIKINHHTGRLIANAFGRGIDYVVIKTAPIGANDVDDLAFDVDGTLFGIAGNSGSGGDRLVVIDKKTGAATDFGALQNNGKPVQDMEGLTLYNSNELYGTTGLEFSRYNTDNTLYRIDKQTGEATPVVKLDNDFNGYVPKDFEAITCFPVCRR